MKTIVCLAILIVFACSNRDVAGGGSSVETDNSLTIQALNKDGTPSAGAVARIRPLWYVAGADSDTLFKGRSYNPVADSQGMFRMDSIPEERYMLELIGSEGRSFVEINLRDTANKNQTKQVRLSPIGKVVGATKIPDGSEFAVVQIYGFEHYAITDSQGNFSMDSLPSGILHFRTILQTGGSVLAEDLVKIDSNRTSNVGVMPDATIYSENAQTWMYSKLISVDSLISDWMLPITSPTVGFLRLDSTSFDFSQVMGDGRDLRFFDLSGDRVSFEIAEWDSLNQRAQIRVRIESVLPGQSILMSWGRPGAIQPPSVDIWEGMSDSLVLELYSLDIDDFEDGDMRSNMKLPVPPHGWYIVPQDTSVVFSPLPDDSLINGLQPSGAGKSGTSFHVTSSAVSWKWTLFGMVMGVEPKNFTAMDSIVYWVRGNGNYQFVLESLAESFPGKVVYADTLDSIWTRERIIPEDFGLGKEGNGQVDWPLLRATITNLTIFAMGNCDIWIDDIRIYGLNRDDLK